MIQVENVEDLEFNILCSSDDEIEHVFNKKEYPALRSMCIAYNKKMKISWKQNVSFPNLEKLDFINPSNKDVNDFEKHAIHLKNLKTLCYRGIDFNSIPSLTFNLENLEFLTFIGMHYIQNLPKEIFNLTHLKHLSLHHAEKISGIPDEISNLKNLEAFNISHTTLKYISLEIFKLPKMQHLSIWTCRFDLTKSNIDELRSIYKKRKHLLKDISGLENYLEMNI
jgi:Leucine-rich repeat (LRR) protein